MKELTDCPTCGDEFDTEHGMKIHHTRAHGESIAGRDFVCEKCGDEFTKYPSRADRTESNYCSMECCLGDRKKSKEELTEELHRMREKLGRVPSQDHLSEHSKYSRTAYDTAFDGGWNEALEEAGMRPNHVYYDKGDCLDDLQAVADDIGHVPNIPEYTEKGELAVTTVMRRFDSWEEAVLEAGLDKSRIKPHNIDKQELLDDIRQVANVLGETPTKNQMREYGVYSPKPITSRFGDWTTGLEEAGFEPNVVDPVTVECSECGDEVERYVYNVERSECLFCSQRCYEEWQQYNKPSGPDHHQYKPNVPDTPSYGANWPRQREKALERDDHTCKRCGISSEEHKEKHGFDLHVHHITPWHKFDDHKERNKLSNLVSLCAACHQKWERLPVKPQMAGGAD